MKSAVPPGSWPRRMSADLAAGYCHSLYHYDFQGLLNVKE
jgi:hypothetical protein